MNTQILQKCIAELEKDKPNLDYIKGILETFVEMSGSITPMSTVNTMTHIVKPAAVPLKSDSELAEEEFAAKYANGPVGALS